jgi:predicted GNAT family acetyltransferase
MSTITDNTSRQRFELIEDGKLAYADYQISDHVMIIPYVQADPALRGQGTAGRLMQGVLEEAKARELKVRPVCSYAAAYIQRHPEFQEVLE